MKRLTRGLLIYAMVILSMASCSAWQVHSTPYECVRDEGDGRGGVQPDQAIERERECRSAHTQGTFVFILLLGGLGLAIYGVARLALRIDLIRRFAEGDDRWP